MHQVVFEITFVNVAFWHHELAFNSKVVAPLACEFAFVRPLHFSVPITFVEFPFTCKMGLLEFLEQFIKLIDYHGPISASFSVFEHASVSVAAFVSHFAPSTESTFGEATCLEFQRFVLEVIFNILCNSSGFFRPSFFGLEDISKCIFEFSGHQFIAFIGTCKF